MVNAAIALMITIVGYYCQKGMDGSYYAVWMAVGFIWFMVLNMRDMIEDLFYDFYNEEE